MKPAQKIRWSLLCACAALSFMNTACEEDDPEPNIPGQNNTNTTNNTNNKNNNTMPAIKDCASACAALEKCDGVDATCQGLNFKATCEARCAQDDSVIGYATLSCAAVTSFLDDAAGLHGTCAQIGMCQPAATDYSPGANDQWAACVSDGGMYSPFEMSISSIARVEAFDEMAALLWERATAPTPMDFIKARELYAAGEGLDSRVQRREDEHYPPVTDGQGNTLRCRDEGVPALSPDRCVGPAKMLPILNDAFNKGINGESPRVNAARIEAALLWFLYISTHKEAITCTSVKKDCDSAYAYYTGGASRDSGVALARLTLKHAKQAHERAWDGVLAVRCWRDLDSGDPATDLMLRDRAVAQLDRALLYGFSRIVAARVATLKLKSGDMLAADWAWLKIMVPVLDREATLVDAALAKTLRDEIAKAEPGTFDAEAVLGAIDALFPCP